MSLLVASLYLLCLAFLFGSAIFVYSKDPFSRLNSSYALLALSLLCWVGSLFFFSAETQNPSLLWLGRFNFAAAAVVAPSVYFFVCALASKPILRAGLIWVETGLLVIVSLFTGLVDKSEAVVTGEHITAYGALFPLYMLHILAFVILALLVAFNPPTQLRYQTRSQLQLVGVGILLTALVGIVTNVVLPYLFGIFRLIDVGTLSTIVFLAAVAYAVVVHHLFDVRLVIRAAVVFAILIAFALELYQAAVGALTRLLPLGDPTERHFAAAAVALIINAFTQQPLKWWLERLVDRLLRKKHLRVVSEGIRH